MPDDPYPSRVGCEARVLLRREPVLHSSREQRRRGPLSAARLAAYERRGFVGFDTLIERDRVERLIRESRELFRARRDDPSPEVVHEPGGEEVRSIFRVHEDEKVFADLVQHPKVLGIAEQILGGPVYVHQSRIDYEPALCGQPFHWHSDFETWHVEDGMPRMSAFSLSINLSESRADDGPLMFLPESHRYYIGCPGWTPASSSGSSLRRQRAGVPPAPILEAMVQDHGIETPSGPPGGAILFDCNLMHGSNGNIAPFPRTSLFLVFNRVDNRLPRP